MERSEDRDFCDVVHPTDFNAKCTKPPNHPGDHLDEVRRMHWPYWVTGQSRMVNHPAHYGGDTTYEHIKVVRAWGLNYELGNATKYICRAGKKEQANAIEDLEKARWYIEAEIQRRREGGGS